MLRSLGFAAVILVLSLLVPGHQCKKDWWQTALFYQIYPRSFKDSDGDGIGDLNGITSRLEYLKDIGVSAAWLSPIFKSPMVDFGYDISDFYSIHHEYGTIEDFRELIKRATELEIKILLDFVPNHTSNESVWFQKSLKREKGYEDFYVWHDGELNATTGKREPPSNWLQYFRGSAWEWREERQQFYLHQFAVQQPDLNYRNPIVVNQMKDVLRYWLSEGVGGFRIDALAQLVEVAPDAHGQYPDESVSGVTEDKDDRYYLNANYTDNQPETIDMVYQWRAVLDDYKRKHGGSTRVLLVEVYTPPWFTMPLYGNKTHNGAHLPFNFNFITVLKNGLTATNIQKAIDMWLEKMPAGRTPNWVLGNHDKRRAASRYGVAYIDAMVMLIMILPGASVTYQGEELGMTDGNLSWADTVDPWACRSNPSIFNQFTRDPARTPFHWTNGTNAGFSDGPRTWLKLADDYKTINVASESAAPISHLKIYKALVDLRRISNTLQEGATKHKAVSKDLFLLVRSLANSPSIVLVANFGSKPETLNLTDFDSTLPTALQLLIRSVNSDKSEGTIISTNSLLLHPAEALVLGTVGPR